MTGDVLAIEASFQFAECSALRISPLSSPRSFSFGASGNESRALITLSHGWSVEESCIDSGSVQFLLSAFRLGRP